MPTLEQNKLNVFFENIDRYDVEITKAGDGALLWDNKGKRWLLDFWGDESVQGLGYGRLVTEAMQRFIESGEPHQLPDIYPNDVRSRVAERLCTAYGFDKIFFDNSGSEAIETALKIVRQDWSRKGQTLKKDCYTFRGNFHGRTYGALALSDSYGSGSPHHKDGFEQSRTPWQGYGVVDEFNYATIVPRYTAAIFIAPVEGNHCVRGYSKEFFQKLRMFCTDNDILLVFDEIQTGSGWMGIKADGTPCYSAAQGIGIQPDVMTLGKRIALGFPMTATVTTNDIAACIGKGQLFNSFAGSPFVCWMANTWLDWLEGGGAYQIAEKGKYIRDRLKELPFIRNVNQYGMMMSFEPDYHNLPYNGDHLCREALNQGLLMVTHRKDKEVRFSPPCAISYEQIDMAIDALSNADNVLVNGR